MPGVRLLLGTALLAAAGCAQQPVTARHGSPAAVPATAPPTAASNRAMKSTVPPRILLFAHDQGYRQVVIKGGTYYFCKTEDPMGSIIPTHQCVDQSQLEFLQQKVTQQQEQLSRRVPQTGSTAGP
ncbi:MAG TPA: hypothetical protein VFX20_17400 [Steroidobacteraceae bacterium]|nr:hypothetical protein [Steroidobacteraceae bacterium]